MPSYYYSSTAGSYTLTGDVSPSATILVINTVSGLPTSTPFKVVVDAGQPSEEIVKVTAVAGTSLTVVRGWDGTSGADHAAGAVVRHMVTAEDFTLSRAHEDATAAHGATGAVVGTTNAQGLSNKDLSNGTNTFPAALVTLTGSQTLSNKILAVPTITSPTITQATLKGDAADTATIFSVKNNANTELLKAAPDALNVGGLKVYYPTAMGGSGKVLEITNAAPGVVPIYVKADAAQTSPLIEARTSDDTVLLFRVSATGAITSPTTTGMQFDVGALQVATADSGWVNISIAGGKAGSNGESPQVRKIGKQVNVRWGWANTGLTTPGTIITVGTVPVGYRPARLTYINVVGSTGNQRAMATIDPSGEVAVRIGTTALDYYLFPGELSGWFTD